MAHWTSDGTQDPEPQPVASDPLAGLVTGARGGADTTEPPTVRVVNPPPATAAPRDAVASVLGDDSELGDGSTPNVIPVAPDPGRDRSDPPTREFPVPDGLAAGGAAPTPPAGMPAVPDEAPALRVGGQSPTGGEAAAPDELPHELPRPVRASRLRTRSSATSIALIIVLLAVIVVIAIVAIASLVDTIVTILG